MSKAKKTVNKLTSSFNKVSYSDDIIKLKIYVEGYRNLPAVIKSQDSSEFIIKFTHSWKVFFI